MSSITGKDIEDTRVILGNKVKDWSDEKLKDVLANMNFLVETWMDEYERSIFDCKTLSEIVPGINNPLEEDREEI